MDVGRRQMENLVVTPSFWADRRVFLTGHTGFKGAWLSIWLAELGAKVCGYSLPPATELDLYNIGGVEALLTANTMADIRDLDAVRSSMHASKAEIVFHLAAQSLVRESYRDPIGTYATNVMGTANVLEAARTTPSVRAVVVITTDKCYENNEWPWGYREIDRLGGHDSYSSSKACAELVATSYRRSFFRTYKDAALIATARAGNVIGGGDWSNDRLIPDIVRSCLVPNGRVVLRNPQAIRPWQHVLEPLRGYLTLAERLVSGDKGYDEAWNFGPDSGDERAVLEVAQALIVSLGAGEIDANLEQNAPHEATLLKLDCSKAKARLGWAPRFGFAQSLQFTSDWYGAWRQGKGMSAFTRSQIQQYMTFGASNI